MPTWLFPSWKHCSIGQRRVAAWQRAARGVSAGVPQLVMAMSHDQPDNGHRITRFGVGAYLYPKAFTPRRVTTMLAHLTSSPDVANACRKYRTQIENQMPAEAVFRLLEDAHREACG
jgi:rhamnosyltransferase subunit B